jgi:dual specificity MAP kinase phosphatase
MSFLDQLKSKKKSLERVETKLTTESGLVYKEIKSVDGFIKQSLLTEQTFGFVVDIKPDLHVGKVFEFLYFGSQDSACDINILSSLQITDILSVGVAVPTNSNLMYTFIEAYDLPTFKMTNIFDDCFIYIENIRLRNRRVYIHCNAGVSRSPTIVIAYVMKYLKLDFKSAYQFVKNTRLTIKPNAGFISQLIDYENKLKGNLYV